MSLRLSSLLNPSPESDNAPPPPRDGALPPNPYLQSPEQYATSPPSAAPQTEQSYRHHTSGSSHDGSMTYDQRPGSSGYNEPMHLPPPPPTTLARAPSSPTLEQYQVASRSPEQRRASVISPPQPGFTLPPLQNLEPSPIEHAARQLNAYEPPATLHSPPESTSLQQAKSQEAAQPPFQRLPDSATLYQSESPAVAIKEEAIQTPHPSSPIDARRASSHVADGDPHNVKAIASLKNEHGLRTHSPLRESSVPVPSTETTMPASSIPKKRPAPSKTKKGTAAKKTPASKKRKVEPKRSVTPSSRASKPFTLGSSLGTPADSSPAPSTRSQSEYDEDEEMEDVDTDMDVDGDVYCICRKPDNGTFMIGCDGTCDDWFHGKCVKIEERNKNLIDKYICPKCTEAGVGKTTWKRMCRRSGCRQPARVGKTKGGLDGSKYCSEECGVLYFREMVAKTRGREDASKNRSNRRKGSIDRGSIDYDLGARGGTIAAGELKSLVDSSATAGDFQKLGDGVLSPPATPDSKSANTAAHAEPEMQALQAIHQQKEDARRKHQLLKDRMKFVTLVKQAAARTATEKELKPKDYCGYDSRLEWTDERFERWRNSASGKAAFEVESLATDDAEEENEHEVCDRKKCARHLEWPKLAVDDVRFEISDNSDHMRALEREEKEVRERAALRAKAGSLNGEGGVEVHAMGQANGQVDGIDAVMESTENREEIAA